MSSPSRAPRPTFFLIGAPKCGTTALSEYLRSHPDIFMCWPKEPFFFCDDLPGLPRIASKDRYLALFRKAPAGIFAVGEASALYLYSRVAPLRIREFQPQARLIVMVRNPIDLAYAFHSQMLYSQNEVEPDFARAWRLQDDRAAGRHVPRGCWEPALLQYRAVASLGKQLQRLLAVFPPDAVRIIVFDDFARKTREAYEETLAFLNVRSDGRQAFPRINQNKIVRAPWLARWTQRPPPTWSRTVRTVKSLLRLERVGFLDPVRRFNLRRGKRAPLAHELRVQLAQEFYEDVSLLSELLERDLMHWLRVDRSPSARSPD